MKSERNEYGWVVEECRRQRKPKKHKPQTKEPTARELAMDAYSTLSTWVNKWLMDCGIEINEDDDDAQERIIKNAPQDLHDVFAVLSKLIAVLS